MSESKTDWQDREVGALWTKEGGGQRFYSGFVEIDGEKREVVIFKNKFKEKENQPDLRIYKSIPKGE